LYVENSVQRKSVLVKRRQKRRYICVPDKERAEGDYVKNGLPAAKYAERSKNRSVR